MFRNTQGAQEGGTADGSELRLLGAARQAAEGPRGACGQASSGQQVARVQR